MKKTVVFGLLVILLAFGFIGCDNNGEDIYTVTIGTLSNGKISANPTSGVEGVEITLTVTPDIGYRLKAGTLKYGTTAINETTLKFNLPAGNVIVTAEFEAIADIWSPLTSWSQLDGTWLLTSSETVSFKDFYESEVGELPYEMQQLLGNMNIKTDNSNTIIVDASGDESTWTWAQTNIYTFTMSGGNIDEPGVWEALEEGFSVLMPEYENEFESQTMVMIKPSITRTRIYLPSSTENIYFEGFKINQFGTRKIFDDDEIYFWVKQ